MTAEEIVRRVARRTGVPFAMLRAPNSTKGARKTQVARARQRAMWALRQQRTPEGKRRFSTTWIGKYLGGRDHRTVIQAEHVHPARRQEEHGAWRGRARHG